MNYINAGVISPDEVRSVLREDVNSGYNTLSEEMEGEGENEENDPFADLLGGSETPQNPFSSDKWEEGDPRRANGQFGEGGSGKVEKSQRSDKIRKRTRKEIQLPKDEYARVMSEIRTNITSEEKQKKVFRKPIGNHIYRIENIGDYDYRIIGKSEI